MHAMPRSLATITPEWLTSALQANGHDSLVTGVRIEPMPGIVGALGEIGIVHVDHAVATGLPDSFVAKCPLDDDTARMYNAVMQHYPREAGFYRDLAHRVELRVPECYVNVHDPEHDLHLLVLEHVTPARPGDILEGEAFDTMLRLTEDLATMHAHFWGDEGLRELPWMMDWSAPSLRLGIELVQQNWTAFAEEHPAFFPPDLWEVLDRSFVNDTVTWLERFDEREWTFIHQDYELDNMLFDAEHPVICDWQTCMRSFPGLDLGWFLATSHTWETRERERELLDRYREVLAAEGGPAWSHERLLEDLAWGMVYFASTGVIPFRQDNSVHGERGVRMHRRFARFLEGSRDAALRWGTVDTIGPLVS